ncbi:putative sorting nexin [Helianthus anomalus]
MKKVTSPCLPSESSLVANKNVSSLKTDSVTKITTSDLANSFTDNEEGEKDRLLNHEEKVGPAGQLNEQIVENNENFPSVSALKEDPLGVPAEWSPPNVSVPLLNLVDKIFQLKRRGWLRRQVFWISKQILQLMMEDAIDDWLLRQIHFLRRDNIVAQGIHMLQDILWPEGTFFLKSRTSQTESSQSNDGSGNKNNKQGSFEEQLEAARRASDIKKMIFKGAPTTLVSLIGRKQYKRSAKDVYYFLQSAVCLKQLGYGLLELALIAIFPELQGIILNVHEKKKEQVV